MPYSIQHLIEGRSDPITAFKEESIKSVLDQMVEHDFSQLPVIDSDNHPVGMVTYEGILRGIRNFKVGIKALTVRDVMSSAPQVNMEDDMFEVLETLKQTNAVLIVDSHSKLIGIVTSYDSTEYFRNRAENMMRVEDIETMIKELILFAYTLDNGEQDEAGLNKIITSVTQHASGKNKKTKGFDELSFGQYRLILLNKEKWPFFEPIFKWPKEAVGDLFESVRITRNDLAHFRQEITANQSDQLRHCAEWLARCYEDYEQIGQKMNASGEAREMTDESGEGQDTVEVIAEEAKPGESRYVPLADWLNSQPGKIDQVTLSFSEIEEIIGGNLPVSAHTHRAWWANDTHSHLHSRMWLEVGWRRTRLNITKKEVSFVRIQEREKAYIEFFSGLLAELREKTDFPLRDVSPDGASWIIVQTLSSPRNVTGQFNYTYSFSRDRRLRIELYLDTHDRETTKQVFDRIHAHKESLEAELGQISWERLDDKRASRIAVYHPGTILDDQEKLDALQKWAASTMNSFYKAIEPLAAEAVREELGGVEMTHENIITGQKVTAKKAQRAKELRQNMTPAEQRLWQQLRANRLDNRHFRRQQIVDGFIVDFYCHRAGLVIEVDGPIHEKQQAADSEREAILRARGLTILRFTNGQVMNDMQTVLQEIRGVLDAD